MGAPRSTTAKGWAPRRKMGMADASPTLRTSTLEYSALSAPWIRAATGSSVWIDTGGMGGGGGRGGASASSAASSRSESKPHTDAAKSAHVDVELPSDSAHATHVE